MEFLDDIEQCLKMVRFIFVECPKLLGNLQDELVKIDHENQDLLHVLELGKLNAVQRTKIVNEIVKLRKTRRQIKNDIEILNSIEGLFHQKPNEHNIGKALGDIRKIKKNHELRTYKMRVRTDLQELLR